MSFPRTSAILQMVPNPLRMAANRLKNSLSRLDVTRKWVFISAALLALSTIMPWYEDLDAFGAGDLYLGVTGPLFLIGLMVLASALFVGAWIILPTMGKRLPSFPVKEGALFTFLGIQDLLLLLVANSVFFHPKFGVNITLKDTRFGMIVAFAGVILMIWSGYSLYRKDRVRRAPADEMFEPLVKMPEQHAGHRELGHAPRHNEPTLTEEKPVRREPIERSPEDKSDPQPLRMDL